MRHNGKGYGNTGYGGSGIYDAEPWANPKFFRNYYDVPVTFYGSYPLVVQSQLETNRKNSLKNDTEIISTYGPPNDEDYESGKWPAWKYAKGKTKDKKGVQLDRVITKDNKTYVLQCSYITRIENPETKNCDDKEKGEPYWIRDGTVTEREPPVYVGGTYVVALYGFADCKCSAETTIPNKDKLEGEVPVDDEVIGKKVTMQVNLQQKEDDLKDWKEWVKGKTDFEIRIRVWRSDQTDVLQDLANTGERPVWSKSKVLEPATDDAPNLRNKLANSKALISYLDGSKDSKVLFDDDLTKYPIPEGGTVSFRYNADVYIYAKDEAGKEVFRQCIKLSPSTEMTWYRPKKPDVDEGFFFSVPKYYSEIKEGSPQTSGTSSNETFDAMSGTPTTRNLYFATGGSEFIVDVQVEYVPKVTQQRTYKSEFKSVVNGWAMESIDGGKSDPAPAKPAARVVKDACGVSFTEEVTQTSAPYIKGYTTGENPQPIYGTEYGWYQSGHPNTKVGGYIDEWTQTVTFDYMKIEKAVVWKIERSEVNGMATLVGTDEVTANVKQGDPTWFYNRATDTSASGRLRYSVETNQHDTVYWNEGDSDNCLSNSKAGPVNEQKKFDERRNTTGNVTAVSDFLILQTSSGDQSVMYFEKQSNTAKTTEQLDVPITDFATMWTNNPLSAANWSKQDTIHIGSYNGNYGSPSNKYSPAGGSTVSTVFDSKPAGLNRPARPSAALRIMQTGLDVPDWLPNGEYMTGTSRLFYSNVLNDNPDKLPTAYPVQQDAHFGGRGLSYTTAYSPIHSKVNDVVIHNPVSVQDALVIPLSSHLDQRTPESKAIGGNNQEGIAEYQRILDPNYRQNIIANPDAEIVNVNGTVAGWNTWVATGDAANIVFTHRAKDTWVIGPGQKTFEVNTLAKSGTTGGYWKDIPVKPGTEYQFDGDISCHRCTGYFSLNFYTSDMKSTGSAIGANSPVTATGTAQHKTFTFTSPADAAYLRVHMIKGNNVDSKSYDRDYLFADNLSLKNMSKQEFVAVEPVAVTEEIANPDYRPATPAKAQTFEYTGAEQTFKAEGSGTYTIEVWGAQGGTTAYGGKGGYAKGEINLNAGETLNIYVGGNTGWNGGGSGHGRDTESGGGASDVRKGGTSLQHRIIVAGGGGGPSGTRQGGSGGGESGGIGDDGYGSPGTGGTQTSGGAGGSNYGTAGTLGHGGSNTAGTRSGGGGGGGGWYGGGAGGNDYPSYDDPDDSGGGGGSGYIGGVQSGSMQSGIQSGNGKVSISVPDLPASGSPTKPITTLAGGSDTSPPSDAYILVPVTVNPNQPAGGYTPGKFILLDYKFQLYFPNTGDFFGNGQWGWSQTTEIRGKGFTDNMDTTEWTRAKSVKFDFNVIYDNSLYLANEWIPLKVDQTVFDFYLPLANREKISALVEWKSIAINAAYEDNDTPTNKVRYNTPLPLSAKHSTNKKYDIDVVGRIGNMTIQDTGDFRFSNLFKKPLNPIQWLIPNVVKKVDPYTQNHIVGDRVTILGDKVDVPTRYLNTWGLLGHLEREPISFPLSAEKNNIEALKKQPLRLGYEVFTDIQTMGNYYGNLQITPYYYHLNLQSGVITPVDIYMKVGDSYQAINKHGAVQPSWNPSTVYSNAVTLNWEERDVRRRNVTVPETDLTNRIAALFAESGGDNITGKASEPYGIYPYGNSQLMQLTGRNRTYIGQDTTYGADKNPGNRLSILEYAMQAQRWHYSYVLPSSAVAVRKGQAATQANINALRSNTGVILLAADIVAVGDTYSLQYKAPNGNGGLQLAGTSWPLNSIPYPVVAVYSSNKSSADDLQISGTH
ncbi:glycine-rich protein [Paenibacillus pinisoli]|uniref:glycine-rich protein n=1 Tax=Paenibacillus pinisoli TaxID=1276110 RepID=UPI0014033E26|nr:glycine-rich protein [Paenibacillus pinisoli]